MHATEVFVVFPPVSRVVLSALVCDDLGLDGTYLRKFVHVRMHLCACKWLSVRVDADYRVSCDSNDYAKVRAAGIVFAILWPLGAPLFFLGLMYAYKVGHIWYQGTFSQLCRALCVLSIDCNASDFAKEDLPSIAIWLQGAANRSSKDQESEARGLLAVLHLQRSQAQHSSRCDNYRRLHAGGPCRRQSEGPAVCC